MKNQRRARLAQRRQHLFHKQAIVGSIPTPGTMWATRYIESLKEGQTVQFRPHGNSMRPRIESGQLVTVVPFNGSIDVSDIVLCKVEGRQFLHVVSAVGSDGRVLISNNHGHVNGWCSRTNIFGVVTRVDP